MARLRRTRSLAAMELDMLVRKDPYAATQTLLAVARRLHYVRAEMARAFGISPTLLRNYITTLKLGDELDRLAREAGYNVPAQRKTANGPSFVYFVQQGADGPIKIGIATNVKARIAALQTANPTELMLRAEASGGRETEARLHRVFHHARMEGEWFQPVRELTDLIDALADGVSLDAILEAHDG